MCPWQRQNQPNVLVETLETRHLPVLQLQELGVELGHPQALLLHRAPARQKSAPDYASLGQESVWKSVWSQNHGTKRMLSCKWFRMTPRNVRNHEFMVDLHNSCKNVISRHTHRGAGRPDFATHRSSSSQIEARSTSKHTQLVRRCR